MEAIRLEGVKDLEAALKRFDIDASKELDKAINAAAGVIRKDAKGFIPDQWDTPVGLSNWAKPSSGKMMNGMQDKGRQFPIFNTAEMKQRLVIKKERMSKTRNGFGKTVYIEQMSPVGNIYEKAGVVAGGSTRKNYSRNPNASLDFKRKIQQSYFIRKGTGRALIRAGIEDAGKAKALISRARYEAELALQKRFDREATKNG